MAGASKASRASTTLLAVLFAAFCCMLSSSEPLIELLFAAGPGFTYWSQDGSLMLTLKNTTRDAEWTIANKWVLRGPRVKAACRSLLAAPLPQPSASCWH